MNDDRFGGELHAWIEPEIEARLVALILGRGVGFRGGRAGADDEGASGAADLQAAPGGGAQPDGRGGEAAGRRETGGLAPERRAEVMEALGIDAPEEPAVVPIDAGRERRVRRAGLRVAMMAAACLVISVVLAPFLLRGTKSGWAK